MRKLIELKCENCLKTFITRESYVKRGRGRFCSKSCAASGKFNNAYKHGNAPRVTGQTKEYRAWAGIKNRVTIGNDLNRKYYLERGITMCDRWFNSFESFLEDMGEAPSPQHQVDRIDFNGNYEPNNCKWVTRIEQMNNVRTNKFLELNGKRQTQSQWARELGHSNPNIISKRLNRGWSLEKTLTAPVMKDWKVNDWRKR